MLRLIPLVVTIVSLATALPKSLQLPVCGTTQGPGKDCASYPDDVADNLAFFGDDPDHLTWTQCHDTCRDDKRCKSFRYVIQQSDYPFAGIACNHFGVPISDLLVSCDTYRSSTQYLFTLDAYYDAECPSTLPNLFGEPTKKEDAFCAQTPKINMKKFSRSTLAQYTGMLDTLNQESCKSHCDDHLHCLSYFWAPYAYAEQTVLYPNGTREQSSDDDSHSECVLLSETVEGLNDTVYGNTRLTQSQVFDLNCEVRSYY